MRSLSSARLLSCRRAVAFAFLVAAVFLFLQRETGLPLSRSYSLNPDGMETMGETGSAYVRLPVEVGQIGSLLENGRRIGARVKTPNEVITKGGGSFREKKGALFFSSSDRTDPKTNRRTYVFKAAIRPHSWWVAACFLLAAALVSVEIVSGTWKAVRGIRNEIHGQSDAVIPAVPIMIVMGALLVGMAAYFLSPGKGRIEGQFLGSWENYLESYDISPQASALKASLVTLLVGSALVLLYGKGRNPEISVRPAVLFVIGAALFLVVFAAVWLELDQPSTVLSLLLVGITLSCAFHFKGEMAARARRIICLAGLVCVAAALAWGVTDFKFSGLDDYFSSGAFSWHYGAYYEDAVRIADQAPFSELHNYYGLTWQILAGMVQRAFGWWGVENYVSFTRGAQMALLLGILLWLVWQDRLRPSWWLLVFGIVLCLIYHGSSISVLNGTQSLLRRSGFIVCCCTLEWFARLAERRPGRARWIATVHGAVIGLSIPFSTEFGCLIAAAGAFFWSLSTNVFSKKCLGLTSGYVIGCGAGVGFFVALTWVGGSGLDPRIFLQFLGTSLQKGFGGVPMEWSPMALAAWMLAAGLFVNGIVNWRKGAVSTDLRIVTVCASLTLPLMMYYLQRNHTSSLHTALLPLGFACIYWFGRRRADSISRPRANPLSWWAPACVVVLLGGTVQSWAVAEFKLAKTDLGRSRMAALVADDRDEDRAGVVSENQRAFVEQLRSDGVGFVFISPVAFQAALELRLSNRVPGENEVFDYVHGILTQQSQDEAMERLHLSGTPLVLVDDTNELTAEEERVFWAERKAEIERGLEAVGYLKEASGGSGWIVYRSGRANDEPK